MNDLERRFYGYDRHGSVRSLTDLYTAAVTDTYGYDAFGNLTNSVEPR